MFVLRERNPNTHKGNYGKVLIVAGSKGMAGAAVLCARSALRSGAGLVQVSVPDELVPIVQISVPEATCVDREKIVDTLDRYDAVVFGPGIGTGGEEATLLQKILEKYEKSMVIDADGLNILGHLESLDLLKDTHANIIITPHAGETMRLLKLTREENKMYSRLELARMLQGQTGATVVLKGHETLVLAGQDSWVNTTGNPGMATGGSGDVLAGIIGSLCGQGFETWTAAKMGVYIHGLAGDLAKEELGEYGMIAGDLCHDTAKAMQLMVKREKEQK